MDPVVLLKGVLPAIGAALVLVSLAGARLLPLAAAIGLYVAHGLLLAWPDWPHELWSSPVGSAWLVWSLALAAVVATLERLRLLPPRTAAAAGVAVAVLAVWLVTAKVAQQWTGAEIAGFVGGGGVLAAVLVLAARRSLGGAPAGIQAPALWALVLSLDAGLVVLGKSALLGQLCGAVAAAVGAAAATTVWRRAFALVAADGTWIGLAHVLFVFAAVHLAYLPWAAAGPALAVPLLLLCLPQRLGAGRPWRWFAVAAPVALAPLVLAMWLAQGEANPYGY